MAHQHFSSVFKEKRLLAFSPPVDAPKPPESEEMKITQKLETEMQPLSADAVKKMTEVRTEVADKDASIQKTKCQESWETAAKIYFDAVTTATPPKSHEDAVTELNKVFAKANAGISFRLGSDGKSLEKVAAPAAPATGAEKPQLTPDQQQQVKKFMENVPPSIARLARPVVEVFIQNGGNIKSAEEFVKKFKTESGKIKDTESLKKFANGLQGQAKPFAQEVVKAIEGSLAQPKDKPEKLSEADKIAISVAAAEAYGNFNPDNATEGEKNMVIARLMMMGIDTANTADIFSYKPGPNGEVDKAAAVRCFKPLEGTQFEMAMNKVMGLISYIMTMIDKFNPNSENNKKKPNNAPAAGPAVGPDGKPKEVAGASGEKPTDEALKAKVKEKGYGLLKTEADAGVTAEKNKLDGVAGAVPPGGLNAKKPVLDGQLRTAQTRLDQEKQKLIEMKGAKPADLRTQEDKIANAEKAVGKLDLDVKNLDTEIATATKRLAEYKATQTALTELLKQSNEFRKQVGEQITAVNTAVTPPAPGSELALAKAVKAALGTLTVPAGVDGKLEFALGGVVPAKMEAAAKAIGDASAWQLDGAKLKNPEAFLASLKGVIGKVQAQKKEADDKKEEQKNNAISPKEAANVALLKNKGLKIVKDGTWKPDEKDGKNPTIEKVCEAISPTNRAALDPKIITGLSSYLNEQLQDITKDSGKVALASLLAQKPGNWTNAADQYSNLAAALKGDGFPQGVTYDEAGNVQLFKPDAAMKAKIQPKLPAGFNAALKAEMGL